MSAASPSREELVAILLEIAQTRPFAELDTDACETCRFCNFRSGQPYRQRHDAKCLHIRVGCLAATLLSEASEINRPAVPPACPAKSGKAGWSKLVQPDGRGIVFGGANPFERYRVSVDGDADYATECVEGVIEALMKAFPSTDVEVESPPPVLCPRCHRPAERRPEFVVGIVDDCVRCLACSSDHVLLRGRWMAGDVPDDVRAAAFKRCHCSELPSSPDYCAARDCPIHVRPRLAPAAKKDAARDFLLAATRDQDGVEAEDVYRAWSVLSGHSLAVKTGGRR